DISGQGNVTQAGPGTGVLSGHTTYTGTTTILQGALIRLNPGPPSDTPPVNLAPGAMYTTWVPPFGPLANITATACAGDGSQAALRAGLASAQTAVTMSFRTRSATDPAVLVSDILTLSGMAANENTATPPFALELSYNPALIGNEAALAASG